MIQLKKVKIVKKREKMKQEKIEKTINILKENYKEYKCGLNFDSPFELLVATILSAQCTDERVNKVTKVLFKKANTPKKILSLGEDGLKEEIKTCGLSNSKAKNIILTCKTLIDEYDSNVPRTMEELTALNGVGRKTANVVMSNAYGVPAIAVDTHVQRVSNRIGLAKSKDVLKTEKQLMENIPRDFWSDAHHWIIWHGRKVCLARKPNCIACCLKDVCEKNGVNK